MPHDIEHIVVVEQVCCGGCNLRNIEDHAAAHDDDARAVALWGGPPDAADEQRVVEIMRKISGC